MKRRGSNALAMRSAGIFSLRNASRTRPRAAAAGSRHWDFIRCAASRPRRRFTASPPRESSANELQRAALAAPREDLPLRDLPNPLALASAERRAAKEAATIG